MAAVTVDKDVNFEKLRTVVAPIAEGHGVKRVHPFGSRARGDDDSNGDFDFHIVPGRIQTLTKLCGLLRELEEALDAEVDMMSEGPCIKEDFFKKGFVTENLSTSRDARHLISIIQYSG